MSASKEPSGGANDLTKFAMNQTNQRDGLKPDRLNSYQALKFVVW